MKPVKNVTVTRSSAVLVAASAVLLGAGCGRPSERGTEEVPPNLTFESVEFRVYRGPAMTAQGVAAVASFRRDNADLDARTLDVWFPPSGSRAAATVTAAQGQGNLRERRFFASGGVRAVQGDQVAVTAEARYQGSDGLIRGDRSIVVEGGHYTARGPAFTLDPRTQVLVIEGGAQVQAGGRAR